MFVTYIYGSVRLIASLFRVHRYVWEKNQYLERSGTIIIGFVKIGSELTICVCLGDAF